MPLNSGSITWNYKWSFREPEKESESSSPYSFHAPWHCWNLYFITAWPTLPKRHNRKHTDWYGTRLQQSLSSCTGEHSNIYQVLFWKRLRKYFVLRVTLNIKESFFPTSQKIRSWMRLRDYIDSTMPVRSLSPGWGTRRTYSTPSALTPITWKLHKPNMRSALISENISEVSTMNPL